MQLDLTPPFPGISYDPTQAIKGEAGEEDWVEISKVREKKKLRMEMDVLEGVQLSREGREIKNAEE